MSLFKIAFEGSLYELFEACAKESALSMPDLIAKTDQWFQSQLQIEENLLPVRKFSGFSARGMLVNHDDLHFICVDNEPLAYIVVNAETLLSGAKNLRELIAGKVMPASWSCDFSPKPNRRFSGVKANFREKFLKLAHIENAGQINHERFSELKLQEQFQTRFLRSLCLSNVFLFPSSRRFSVEVTQNPANLRFTDTRLEECESIRAIAKGSRESQFVVAKMQYQKPELFDELSVPPDWENLAKELMLRVTHREAVASKNKEAKAKTRRPVPSALTQLENFEPNCFPRNSKRDAKPAEEAMEDLIVWRQAHPEAQGRLDGKKDDSVGVASWFHFKVGGFKDGNHDFITTKTKEKIMGSEYNGVVNFHGDARWEAIDSFLAAYNAAESIQDVLVPSATYEFTTLPKKKKTQSKKLALNGFEGVQRFYLYFR